MSIHLIIFIDCHLFLKPNTSTMRTLRSMVESPVCLKVKTVSLFLGKVRLLMVALVGVLV